MQQSVTVFDFMQLLALDGEVGGGEGAGGFGGGFALAGLGGGRGLVLAGEHEVVVVMAEWESGPAAGRRVSGLGLVG